jgi:hypothetical protein
MPNQIVDPYTPDQVPVEIPLSPEEMNPKRSKTDAASTFMVMGIILFVVIIFIEAFFLVQKTTSTQTEASTKGPTLQQ